MNELAFILGFIGLMAGAWLFGFRGAILGGILGFLLGAVIDLRARVRRLEGGADLNKGSVPAKEPQSGRGGSEKTGSRKPAALEKIGHGDGPRPEKAISYGSVPAPSLSIRSDSEKKKSQADRVSEPSAFEKKISDFLMYIRTFFTTGNVVVKVGVIVLFFGVAFLIKYAADRSILPIEFRLCGIAAAGIALLIYGWRTRHEKRVFGLSLQGGGIGILYLTVFSAVRLYDLIPPFLAICLMVSFVILSAFIAVIQDARALAVLSSAGGFLAPVLVSTGGGSHVMFFSYYLLLNAGILEIAWFKSWRELNLTGFVFTFVISAIWGLNYYRPEFFETTEPFLVIFFLMYASISVFSAIRQPPNLKGYVDGPLVFGLPLVAFGLQCGLVRHFEYGIAISSLFLAAYYVFVSAWLWKRKYEGIRMLTEAFLAVGVVFATLAIPFAFDRQWISASWALEGASMVWIGLRQKRVLARTFGLFLQVCAGFTLLTGPYRQPGDLFVLNTEFFNNIIMAFSGLISGFFYHYYSDRLFVWEKYIHGLAGFWGTIWWLGGGLSEIERHISHMNRGAARLFFMALTSSSFTVAVKYLKWPVLSVPPLILVPWMIIHFSGGIFKNISHPFEGAGLLAWGYAAVSHFHALYSIGEDWKKNMVYVWHMLGFFVLVMILSWEVSYYLDLFVGGSDAWGIVGWSGIPGILILLMIRFGDQINWPGENFKGAYFSGGCSLMAIFLMAFFMWACTYDGDASPLAYVPLFNPSDLMQLFVIIVLFIWSRAIMVERMPVPLFPLFRHSSLNIISAALLFLLFNIMVARCVHAWAGVSYDMGSLFDSFLFQASISIVWTLSAMFMMMVSSLKGVRKLWFAGAWVLCGVVMKLFFVDLGGRGTGERIISFIAVGVLMLLIGYFSPLPPSVKSVADETTE